MITLQDLFDELAPEDRRRVEKRAEELIAQEMSLRQLRRAVQRTQVEVAQQLGVNQENISRLERRGDVLLSTLDKYIRAMGGKLSLVAEFPDHPPVLLRALGAEQEAVDSDWSAQARAELLELHEDAEEYEPAR